jgi:hypothetical protein
MARNNWRDAHDRSLVRAVVAERALARTVDADAS